MMRRHRRLTALLSVIIVLVLLLVIVSSHIYVLHHLDHKCHESHCEVCYILNQADSLIRSIGVVGAMMICMWLCKDMHILGKNEYGYLPVIKTPITHKVKLLD